MRFHFCFVNVAAPPEIYTLSLHDALPISQVLRGQQVGNLEVLHRRVGVQRKRVVTLAEEPRILTVRHIPARWAHRLRQDRSEEHTSELQSRGHLVCRLLLEKKKKQQQGTD